MQQNKPVAVADIAYGNGADNALVKELFNEGKAYRVAATAAGTLQEILSALLCRRGFWLRV